MPLSDEASTATASSELAALDAKYKTLQELVRKQSGQIDMLQDKLRESHAMIDELKSAKDIRMAEKDMHMAEKDMHMPEKDMHMPEKDMRMPEKDEPVEETAAPSAVTLAAARARLRRVCERKADGSCQVPTEVLSQWQAGGASRKKLLRIFMANQLDKQAFIRDVTHELRKSKEMRLAVTGDFMTEEEMKADGTPQCIDIHFINDLIFALPIPAWNKSKVIMMPPYIYIYIYIDAHIPYVL